VRNQKTGSGANHWLRHQTGAQYSAGAYTKAGVRFPRRARPKDFESWYSQLLYLTFSIKNG